MDITPLQALKLSIISVTGLGRDALHIYAGLAVFFSSSLLLRMPVSRYWPLVIAILLACMVEIADLRDDLASYGRWRVWSSVHDVCNTVFWPLIITLLARYSKAFTKK